MGVRRLVEIELNTEKWCRGVEGVEHFYKLIYLIPSRAHGDFVKTLYTLYTSTPDRVVSLYKHYSKRLIGIL